MASYRFITADLLTDTTLAELPFEGVSYSQVLNGPGAFSGKLPLSLRSTSVVAKPYATTVRDDTPSGYWPLTDAASSTTAADLSVNANAGTVSGGVTFDGTAATFNGTSGSVQVAHKTYYSIAETGSFTVEAWVYLTAAPSGGIDAVVAKKGSNAHPEWNLAILSGGTTPRFDAWTGDAFTSAWVLDFGASISLNTWTHLAVVIDGATANAYINGARTAQVPPSGPAASADRGGLLEIGGWAEEGDWFGGELKQVAVYTSALSAERVLAHYNAGSGNAETTTVTVEKVTRTNIDPNRTALYVERDGVLVWGGIITTVSADLNSYSLTVGAEGFWSYFRRRLIRTTTTFAQADQLTIAKTLIDNAQAIANGSIGVVTTSKSSGVLRDRTYNGYERTNLGQAVEDLSALEDGFDFSIDVAYSGGSRVKTFNVFYPRRGSSIPLTLDIASNVEALAWQIDGTQQATSVDALGAGEGDAMLISTAADTSLAGIYPLLEDSVSYKDVSVRATLDAHAADTLTQHRLPPETLSNVAVRDLPVGSFGTGDVVAARTQNEGGFLSLNSLYRVTQWQVDVDDNGKETPKLTVAPLESFA